MEKDEDSRLEATRLNVLQDGYARQIGPYRLEVFLGSGGTGTVYRALDTRLQRAVALKILNETGGQANETKILLQEARALAQMEHPHIVRVYDIAEEPTPYIVMEYVKGTSLAQLISKRQVDSLTAVHIMRKVAGALHEAHKKGVIHRDIKPGNILIAADSEPKLVDFGLARLRDVALETVSKITKDAYKIGKISGTPAYMAPEQIRGNASVKSDIYGIGATLYDTLIGRPPYQGESSWNIIHQIATCEIIPPRRLNPDISVYLEGICMKCLERLPKRRYASARQVEKDLGNFLEHRPLLARPYSKFDRLRKFILRNRLASTLSAAVFFAVIALSSFYLYITARHYEQMRREREAALTAQQQAENTAQALHREKEHSLALAGSCLQLVEIMITENPEIPQNRRFIEYMRDIFARLDESRLSITDRKVLKLRAFVASCRLPGENLPGPKTDTDDGIKSYDRLIEQNPADANAYCNRGILYMQRENYEQAERDLTRAIRLAPDYADAYSNRSALYLVLRRYREAERDVDKAIELSPANASCHYNRGYLYAQTGRYQKAERDLGQAIKLDHKYSKAYDARGKVYGFQSRYVEAERDFNEAIACDPENAEAYADRGELCRIQNRLVEAAKDLENAVRLAPNNAQIYMQRGALHFTKGLYQNALDDWHKAIQLNPAFEAMLTPNIHKAKSMLGQ